MAGEPGGIDDATRPLTHAEVASAAGVDENFVEWLVELELLRPNADGLFARPDVYRTRFLHACDAGGLPLGAIADAQSEGRVSLAFMDNPSYRWSHLTPRTFDDVARDERVPLELLRRTEQGFGVARPEPGDRVRDDVLAIVPLLRVASDAGVPDDQVLRILRTAVDALRRVSEAENYVWHTFVEMPMVRATGEAAASTAANRIGAVMTPLQEEMLLRIYRRQQERVWTQDFIEHVEVALEEMGRYEREERPRAMAFVDVAGYTRLTEDLGDAAAADLAARMSDVVTERAQRRRGVPVKWLGDGVMLYFAEPGPAVEATLEIVGAIPRAGLPPAHAGIASGPVVVQDGDYFGRTVNLASRVSAVALPGQTLVTPDLVAALDAAEHGVEFRDAGSFALKGFEAEIALREAVPLRTRPAG